MGQDPLGKSTGEQSDNVSQAFFYPETSQSAFHLGWDIAPLTGMGRVWCLSLWATQRQHTSGKDTGEESSLSVHILSGLPCMEMGTLVIFI